MPYCDFEVADETGKVLFDKVHDDVEVDLVLLLAIVEEVLDHTDAVLVVEFLEDVQLPVLVLRVLEDTFDGHGQSRLLVRCLSIR